MNTSLQHVTLNVNGMTCRSCAARVQKALIAVPGVESANVDLAGKTATVMGSDLDVAELLEAVNDAGYAAQARPSRKDKLDDAHPDRSEGQ